MDVESLQDGGNKLSFAVKGISIPLANAVRRYSMNHLPILAIDTVTMYENSASIFDEYVAHRIGLIPIKTPKNVPASAEVSFVLDAQGPKVVYSGDLQSSDAGIAVAEPKIPIITLTEGQTLRLEGKAISGTGRKHAKFQAGIVAYEDKEDGSFSFKAESFMQMGAREMLVRGCKLLEGDLEELSDEVSAIGGEKRKKKKKSAETESPKKARKPRAKKAKKEEKEE
ncbi:MAG: DNA-directed RNA polymerase subunit D [Candidatus Pacebacteria bacterium]|nr:DNA-directed RNA polymerase subunit D [Candidatus ainarchaeum sp.]MDD5096613.1 DNA-directed RNA polymerase subunit D [Candidatus ainarchaeum sp.]MDD5318981.1 DNA-directed RNA polymerase subunit D [Candidatus Paceibacterota bacterium]